MVIANANLLEQTLDYNDEDVNAYTHKKLNWALNRLEKFGLTKIERQTVLTQFNQLPQVNIDRYGIKLFRNDPNTLNYKRRVYLSTVKHQYESSEHRKFSLMLVQWNFKIQNYRKRIVDQYIQTRTANPSKHLIEKLTNGLLITHRQEKRLKNLTK